MDLEQRAIANIRLGAQMSKQYYNEPIICTYSGGKDSDVMLDLFIKSGVDFEVQNHHTTVDAPQTVYHIRDTFKRLEDMGIKATVTYPVYKGKRTSMWDLIEQKGMPPTRLMRYCCQVLKETGGANRVIATGVRKDESTNRKTRNEVEYIAAKKSDAIRITSDDLLDFDNADGRRIIEHCTLKSKISINPIIDWTNSDIWRYIRENGIKYNPLYDMGYNRVGCVGCPMGGCKNMKREFADFPVYKQNYIKAFDRMVKRRKEMGKPPIFKDGQDVFDWWIDDKNYIKGQMSLFGEDDQ